ncbi:MAG: TIGR02281 family clan AA aspartic protease [Pseudomonadota bacterium]
MPLHPPALLLAAALAWPALAPAAPAGTPHVSVIGLIGDRAILRIDGEQVILRKGESRAGVSLLGIEAGEALLRVGARERRLGLGMDTGGMAPRGERPSVEVVLDGQGQFITSGMINGRVVQLLVDTGANSVSMTADDARRLGIDYRVDGEPARSFTAGGVVRAWVVRLKSVQVGPIVVTNVIATVREAPTHSPILLGMSFLSQVDLRQERNRLRLTAR